MTRKKKPAGPPPPSHRGCYLCGGRNLVEGKPVSIDMGRGKGPEKYTQMEKCPGPKTYAEVQAEGTKTIADPAAPPPLSGQDRAAGNS
jgi:hypothetical protein